MRAWFRTVLPWEGSLWCFVGAYLVCYFPDFLYWYQTGQWDYGSYHNPTQNIHRFLLILTALLYGGFRGFGVHPAVRKDYLEWLRQTPWRYGLPLPLGPVHLVLQDAVIVGFLSRLAWWHWPQLWWLVPGAFLVMYLLGILLCFATVGWSRHAYALSFGLGGVLLTYKSSMALGLLLAGLYGVAFHGLRHSFQQFRSWDWDKISDRFDVNGENAKSNKLGWPFDSLGPERERFAVSPGWAAAFGILAGWWVFSTAYALDSSSIAGLVFFVHAAGVVLAVSRAGRYFYGYAPPINFWGRLRTYRWIIPRYDVALVGPLLILALVAALGFLLYWKVPPERALSAVTAAYVFVALGFPPNLNEWRLTGSHRIVPAVQKNEMQQLP